MNRPEIEALFSTAIAREIEAYEFYSMVAKTAVDAAVRETFAQLAAEEMGHQELLERFRADASLEMKIQAPAQDYKVAEATELPKLTTSMKPADAIALAMKKEQQAVEFYRGLSASSTDKEVKGIFDNLANMELNHKRRLEDVFVSIGYPESF